uniref:Ribosomal protein S27, isoform 2 n=1 Tax=Mastacembelus armatus TaxID=205130 RepID=A0A7N9AM67_9TELE
MIRVCCDVWLSNGCSYLCSSFMMFYQTIFLIVWFVGCYKITTVFSHAQTVVLCVGCSTVLCQPTGGKARLTEGCSFRRKQH